MEVIYLIRKYGDLDFRNPYSLIGLNLFLISMVLAIYFLAGNLEANSWLAIFWVVMLFLSVQVVLKGFGAGQRSKFYQDYFLYSASHILLARVSYFFVLLFLLALFTYFLFTQFLGNPIQQMPQFVCGLGLGALSFALVFSFVGAMAQKTSNIGTLSAILGFPLLIPVLLLLAEIGHFAVLEVPDPNWYLPCIFLGLLNLLILGLGLLLFPYLWLD